jgi:hypothetical protein
MRSPCTGRSPLVDGHFGPGWHGRSADAAALAQDVGQHPAALALLHLRQLQRGGFGSAQAAADQEAQQRAIAQRAQALAGRGR